MTLDGVDAGTNELRRFASRSGDDGGAGRLTRFTVESETRDLEVGDNTSQTALFTGISPDGDGRLRIAAAVSPVGSARFGYLGTLVLTKTAD